MWGVGPFYCSPRGDALLPPSSCGAAPAAAARTRRPPTASGGPTGRTARPARRPAKPTRTHLKVRCTFDTTSYAESSTARRFALPSTNDAPTQPVQVNAGTAQTSKRGTSAEATTWEDTSGAAGNTALSASDPAVCPEATQNTVRPDNEWTARNRPWADQHVLDAAPVLSLSVFTSAPLSTLEIFAILHAAGNSGQ